MRDKSHSPIRRWSAGWAVSFMLLAGISGSVQAQSANIINCTEEALRTSLGIGGVYQMANCGTTSSIPITKPLVVERDFTLVATQQVILNAQSLTRFFVVRPGAHLTLQNILLFSGRHTETNQNDGGIPATAGAAIYNDGGSVTIRNGRFEANTVTGVTGTAGTAGTGDDGEAGGDGAGGAIYNNGGQLWISNTVFTANSAIGGPGGSGASGNGGLGGNGGNGGNGGSAAGAAIYSRGGRVEVYNSTFSTNTVLGAVAGAAGAGRGLLGFNGTAGLAGDGIGAAVTGDGADLVLYGCTFVLNAARGTNGLAGNAGLRNRSGDAGINGGDAAGAAVYSTGNLQVTNCTFFANSAVSGSGGAGGAGGSSGFGGSGGNGGDGGSATGGAIESVGPATIVNCTFSDNVITPGNGGAGGAGSELAEDGDAGQTGFASGGAVYARTSAVILANNILANSLPTVGGNISDRGGNVGTDANPLLVNPASLRLTNPLLIGFATNGGPTQTFAIATNSPAINAGILEFCPALDQRGSNRVGRCDSGAFEFLGQQLPSIPTNVLKGLTISNFTNSVTLSWPAGYTNLFLQFSTNLLPTNTVWVNWAQVPSTNGGFNTVKVNGTNQSGRFTFFRLFGLTNF